MSSNGSVIRVGVVGCGRVAQQRHLPIIADLPGTELVAVSDLDAETREKVAEKYSLKKVYEDYQELVASKTLDAVMIATPTQFHAEVAVAALRADKHVMIEKPLALSLDEVDQLEAAAAQSSRSVAVAMTD